MTKEAKRAALHADLDALDAHFRDSATRAFFQAVRKQKPYTGTQLGALRDAEGKLCTAGEDVLNRLEAHFCPLLSIPALAHPVEATEEEIKTEVPPPILNQVSAAMASLTRNTPPGPDEIPNTLIRRGGAGLEDALYALFTQMWNEEQLPEDWNDSIIVPLFKAGDPTSTSNYRGITLLATTYKLLTAIIHSELAPMAEEQLADYQCGFRRNRSTINHIFNLQQLIQKRTAKNLETQVIFVDFRKAYDTVHRASLWNAMRNMGIPKKLTRIIRMCQVRPAGSARHIGRLPPHRGPCFAGFLLAFASPNNNRKTRG